MSDSWTIAVYGATGALGREVRVGLEGIDAGFDRLIACAGVRSAGVTVPWRGAKVAVSAPLEVDPTDVDVAIFALPTDLAKAEIPKLRDHGALVVDLCGARHAGGEPLPVVWPTINAEALDSHPGGFALPCGAASTAAPVLDALAGLGQLTEVHCVELVGATDMGAIGAEALSSQTVGLLSYKAVDAAPFRDLLAFNILELTDAQGPREERLVDELGALLPGSSARVRLTTLRVPVFSNTCVALDLRFEGEAPALELLREALEAHPDLDLRPEGASLRDASESDEVLVAALRRDPGGSVRLVLYADPLHRIGGAVATLLEQIVANDLW